MKFEDFIKKKTKVLVVCSKGMNRSQYLAKYLRRKGYSTRHGGVEPYENLNWWKWNPISQEKIDWAEVIILIRKRLKKTLQKKFKVRNKRLIILDVTDSKRLIPEKFKNLRELGHHKFNLKWTYPQLRMAIKPYLPLK